MDNNTAKAVSDVSFAAIVCTALIVVYKMVKRIL